MALRVAIGVKEFTLGKGGLEGHAVRTAGALVARGHEVTVLAARAEEAAVRASGARLLRVPVVALSSALKVWSFHRGVGRALRALAPPPDVVLGLAQFYPLDVYRMGDGLFRHWLGERYPGRARLLAKCVARPVFLVNLRLERRILGSGARLIANSRLCREQAISLHGVAEGRIEVVRNGVDPAVFGPHVRARREAARARLGAREGERVVLFVSNNFERKGLAALLAAMASGRGALGRALLVVAGGDDARPFRRRALALGLDERRIAWTGATPHDAMPDLYAAADALALPTMYDPFSNVCLEAMACGVPVVTTRANGASELIAPGESGLVLERHGDALALAEALAGVLAPGRAEEMGARAAAAVAGLTVDATTEATIAVLARAAEEKARAARSGVAS
jgi:UDP-glucose:(heptosyl)LPS alpha-1,3-glucosyltransferase